MNDDLEKLLEQIISQNFDSEIEILSYIVSEIVQRDDFAINGGRVWHLIPQANSYRLEYQIGKMDQIPLGFMHSLSDDLFFHEMLKLKKEKVVVSKETNKELKKYGIGKYVGTGVGELVYLERGKFFKYLLGFNADNINEDFFNSLKLISKLSTIAIRNYDNENISQKLNKDLQKAADIQRNLLPDHYLEFHDYNIFGVCVPDKEVGGDYFDYITRSDDNEEESVGVVICDCASKGMPAAIQALFVSGAIRMGTGFSTKITTTFGKLNNLINRTFSRDRFVTLFYGELTLSSNRLILYANAGHCPPIHYRPSRDRFKELKPTGGFLGVFPKQKYKLENCRMMPGDTLLLYTDGLSEAQNAEGELFGEERLKQSLKKHHNLPSKEIVYKVLEEVQQYSANSLYNDDKTIVVIKREEINK